MPKVILVTTAGKVGSEAARLLTQRQVPVRVLVRDPEKGKAMADAGVEIAVGDLDIPESINQAMAGVTSVVLVSPAVPAQELNVIASAARAGIEHVVKATSKASADSPIARRRGQAEIEAGLAASGLPHTLLRSNAYMQNTLALAPVIAKTSSFGSSAAKGLVGMVDARDVGAVAAEIAASPAPHAGKTYWLSGPELISNYDVADVLSRLLGRTITYRELSFDEDKNAMVSAGLPEAIAEMNALAFSLTAERDAEWVSEDVPTILGRKARSYGNSPPTMPPHSRSSALPPFQHFRCASEEEFDETFGLNVKVPFSLSRGRLRQPWPNDTGAPICASMTVYPVRPQTPGLWHIFAAFGRSVSGNAGRCQKSHEQQTRDVLGPDCRIADLR